MSEKAQERLTVLFQEMAEHTKPECGSCRVPHSCCDSDYCQSAQEYAQEEWGVDLEPLKNPNNSKVPFLGDDNRCRVAPHFRPLCTLHTCAVNGLGAKPNDESWNKRYFELREEIEELEWQLMSQKRV